MRYYDSGTLPYRVQVNPPKPERESNRRRKKKSLAEDFIDITEASSLYMLDYSTSRSGGARAGGAGGRPAPKSGGWITVDSHATISWMARQGEDCKSICRLLEAKIANLGDITPDFLFIIL